MLLTNDIGNWENPIRNGQILQLIHYVIEMDIKNCNGFTTLVLLQVASKTFAFSPWRCQWRTMTPKYEIIEIL